MNSSSINTLSTLNNDEVTFMTSMDTNRMNNDLKTSSRIETTK